MATATLLLIVLQTPPPPLPTLAIPEMMAITTSETIRPYSIGGASGVVPQLPPEVRDGPPDSHSFALMQAGKESSSPLLVVAAALIDAEGRVLVQRRPAGKSLPGLWEFPGGKVEPGETPEAALIRELSEELAIETWGSCLAPAAFASEALGDRHLILLLYVCRKWRGLPQALHGEELRWVRPLELHALPMPSADRPLIGLLEAML